MGRALPVWALGRPGSQLVPALMWSSLRLRTMQPGLSLADWGGSEARVIDCLVLFLQGCPRPFGFTAEVPREQRGARQRSPGLQGWGWWGAGSGRGRRVRAPRLLLPREPLAQVVRALCASVSPLAPTLREVVVSLEDTRPMKPAPVTLRRVGYSLN